MPPTENPPVAGGSDFDEDFWEELADYLDEPPQRPGRAGSSREPGTERPASAADAQPPQGASGEPEAGSKDPAPLDSDLHDAGPDNIAPDASAGGDMPMGEADDGWWDELWDEPLRMGDDVVPDDSPSGGGTAPIDEGLSEADRPDLVADLAPEAAFEADVAVPGDEAEAEAGAAEGQPADEVGDTDDAPAAGEYAVEAGGGDGDDRDDEAGEVDPELPDPAAGEPDDATGEEDWPRFEPAPAPVGAQRPAGRRRMSARTQRRVAVGLAVAAAVAVIGLVGPVRDAVATAARGIGDGTADAGGAIADRWRSWSNELQTIAADLPARQIDEQRQIEGSESLLFVVEDAGQRTVGVAVLALAPDGGSTLALLPPSLYEILPGYGDFPLADATVFEGADLTAVTVANVLGIRIDDVATLAPGDLATALGGPIQVDLPTALVAEEGGGTQRILAQAGPGERSADQAEALMVVRGTSDPLEWLQRQTAVWDGILAATATDPGVASRLAGYTADPVAATGTLARAAGGEPEVTVVPVTRVSAAGAEEGFKVSYDDAEDFVARRMPHLVLRQGERPRVEVLNGNGRVLTTRSVSAALIRRGFRVVKTDNAENFDFETTLVIAQGRDHRVEADEAIATLGTGELLLELRAPSGVVDVSIIVGHDIPAGEG